MSKRSKGYEGEIIVHNRLLEHGREILEMNYTIRGGELDIVAQNSEFLLCVEVKTVGVVTDIMSYITDKKLSKVQSTFEKYMRKHPTQKQPRIDVFFVRGNKVIEIYTNITGS